MFKILASVLHFGNIKFLEAVIKHDTEQDQEGAMIQVIIIKIKKLKLIFISFSPLGA